MKGKNTDRSGGRIKDQKSVHPRNPGSSSYTFDRNGNLLASGVMTNTFDAANRLVSSNRSTATVQPIYNGAGDRVRQVVSGTTTYYTLDVEGLPEVITSSAGEIYIHLPGVIVTEKAGQVRYLLGDGLGSIRQAVDGTGAVVAYNEFDPYGNPVQEGSQPYGFTGEWWQDEVDLLHLRARWYDPQNAIFLSKDVWPGDVLRSQSLNGWSYVEGSPVNRTDPSGQCIPEYNCPGDISHGVQVSNEFSFTEQDLINQTFRDYADLLGNVSSFRRNIALRKVQKADADPYYDPSNETIVLPLNLYHPSISEGVWGVFQSGGYSNVPMGTLSSQELVFKFVLAHETTHALEAGSRNIRSSFENTFAHKLYIQLQLLCTTPTGFVTVQTKIQPPWSSDPIINRNLRRGNYEGEVLADAIAAYLYETSLIDEEYKDWIRYELPKLLY